MKKSLLTLASIITVAAACNSLYTVNLPNPTEAQTNLGNMTNTIVVAGATAIFGLIDDQEDKQGKDKEDS